MSRAKIKHKSLLMSHIDSVQSTETSDRMIMDSESEKDNAVNNQHMKTNIEDTNVCVSSEIDKKNTILTETTCDNENTSDPNENTDEVVNQNNEGDKKKKLDKRKREAYEPSKWKEIQEKRLSAFRKKQYEKKQKLENYDLMKERIKVLENILEQNNISITIPNE